MQKNVQQNIKKRQKRKKCDKKNVCKR